MVTVVRQWLLSAPDTPILLYRSFFSSLFKDVHDISPAALFHLFSHVYTIGLNWVPKDSAGLLCGFRRRQSWM